MKHGREEETGRGVDWGETFGKRGRRRRFGVKKIGARKKIERQDCMICLEDIKKKNWTNTDLLISKA